MEKEQLDLEKKYLKTVLKELEKQKQEYLNQQNGLQKQKKDLSVLYSEDFYNMDDEEKLTEGDRLAEFDNMIAFMDSCITKINRQIYSPYFGRVDFKENSKTNAVYVGVNNVVKPNKDFPLVCDWRAPVSSLFYDYETGSAEYEAPNGKVKGEIVLKRQYEIKNSELKNAFDSTLTIGDNILKDVLSQNASQKMKTIVSTIQKEQNKIIRANKNKSMLVQGVAGSGKTSIALHRIAYLLYQNKNTLKAEDVLILSPNKLFSEYISDVLPELGEENISQMSFFRLAQKELEFLGIELEKREDNLEEVCTNSTRLNEVAYKHSYEFYKSLETFCKQYFNVAFNPKDLKFGEQTITAKEMLDLYNKTYINKTPAVRVEWIVDYIIDKLNITKNINDFFEKIKSMLYPFFEQTNVVNIYSAFLAGIGMKFSLNKKEQIRYDDIGAIMYISNYFLGINKFNEVKYLIIDEMQDYSFATYDVLNTIFPCNKTILGDINQCIEKVMSKQDLQLLTEMLNVDYVEMNKSYRSTYEITEFASKLKGIQVEPFKRYGKKPELVKTNNLNLVVKNLLNHNSIAVLTKTIKEAKQVFESLNQIDDLSLNIDYNEQINKVCVMPSFMAKGLEFDAVVVPNYCKQNYSNVFDLNILYVSATRALHQLVFVEGEQ